MQLRNLSVLLYVDCPALQDVARAVTSDPRLSRCQIEVRGGSISDAATWLKSNASPDVLVVGDAADDGITSRLDQLAQSVEPGCKVIVVGRRESIGLYRQLIAKGLGDYLGGNIRASDLIDAVERLFTASHSLPRGKVVVSLSTAGGAGGSTVAAFMSASLNGRIGETILLDLDLAMGTAGLMMGTEIRDSVAGALANPGLDVSLLERILVNDKSAKVLSTTGALKDATLLNADAAERVVDVARSMSKALVVDLPKGWGDTHERLLAVADEVILVTTADLPALRNARMILDHLVALRPDRASPRLVLNKAGFAKAREYRADELREALGVRPAAIVPWDPEPLIAAIAAGRPVTTARGKAGAALRAFAETVMTDATRRPMARSAKLFPTLKTLFMKPA